MPLWREWLTRVRELRPACSRTSTFCWMSVVLVGLCARSDLAGVTSFVRALWLHPRAYRRLLHLFHTPALDLEKLTAGWIRLALRLFRPLRLGSRLVLVADGIKVPKEGRKMPAVKKLFQQSENNSKPTFIFGHSFEAIGLLVQGALGQIFCVPLVSRIQEGLVFSNRDQRTLLDRFVRLFLSVAPLLEQHVVLVADALYCTRPTRGRVAYHFWMQMMTPIRRRSGNQYLHMKTERYRNMVRRKMLAYHRYVQLGCVAHGLLQHLALNFRTDVWSRFRSWMRTMNPAQPPSEAVVAQALRNTLPEFLPGGCGDSELEEFILRQVDIERCPALALTG